MKAIIVALASAAALVEAGNPMRSVATGKCVADIYDTLKMGSCSSDSALSVTRTGGYLRTDDGDCIVAPKNRAGARLELGDCKPTPGALWSKKNGGFKNKFGLCIDSRSGVLTQRPCSGARSQKFVISSGSYVAPATSNGGEYVPPVVPPPTYPVQPSPPPTYADNTCDTWSGSCGYGGQLIYKPYTVTCDNGYGSPRCRDVCCKPVATGPATCGGWFDSGFKCPHYQTTEQPRSTPCGGKGYDRSSYSSGTCNKNTCCTSYDPVPDPQPPSAPTCQDFACTDDWTAITGPVPTCSTDAGCTRDTCCSPPAASPADDAQCQDWAVAVAEGDISVACSSSGYSGPSDSFAQSTCGSNFADCGQKCCTGKL